MDRFKKVGDRYIMNREFYKLTKEERLEYYNRNAERIRKLSKDCIDKAIRLNTLTDDQKKLLGVKDELQ